MKDNKTIKFNYKKFSCDVDLFFMEQDVILRFYDKTKEQDEKEIVNCVIVDPGYGYLCLKIKGKESLLSGYLDESIFSSDNIVETAIDFIEDITSVEASAYHIDRFRKTNYVEYNGEY